VQKIFNCGRIPNTSLTHDEVLNVLTLDNTTLMKSGTLFGGRNIWTVWVTDLHNI